MTTILALSSSPRKTGSSTRLLEEALRGVPANDNITIQRIDLNTLAIRPCQHCDGCLKTGKCVIRDDMDMIYAALFTMDALILTAPIYFSHLCAQLKIVVDRCQPFWVAKYILKQDIFGRTRPGLSIATGGQRSYGSQFTGAVHTINLLYKMINVQKIDEILLADTDTNPAGKCPDILQIALEKGSRLAAELTSQHTTIQT